MYNSESPRPPKAMHVRSIFWAVLVAALLFTVSMPAVNLWQQARTDLVIHMCVWPSTPQVGTPARLLVTVPNATDRAAVRGPSARLEAEWDMVTMTMGMHRTALSGVDAAPQGDTTVAVPLHLDMEGLWSARLLIVTPGRPEWQRTLHFAVASAGQSPPPLATNDASAPRCRAG